jgi:ABC-type transport system involved in multi-copper enzyme maturation permease subunit
MWIVALLVVVAPILVWPVTRDNDSVLVFATFGFGLSAVLLSVESFGKEFAHGTYGLLLAQPVSRWLLWREKTLVLGAALGSVLVVFVGAVLVFRLVQNPVTGPFAGLSAGDLALVSFLIMGLLASEWVNLNGKAALEALFTG